jgi:hypothetical protein
LGGIPNFAIVGANALTAALLARTRALSDIISSRRRCTVRVERWQRFSARKERPGAHRDSDPRVCVEMHDRGCKLLFFFADFAAEGSVLEIRLLPDNGELTAAALSKLIPQAPLYTRYARASIKHERGEAAEQAAALREIGTTRRGLPDEFYRLIASNYRTLVAENEPHPVKALSALHSVTISAASRWISEARRRGHIDG